MVSEGLFPGEDSHAHTLLAAIAVPIVLAAVWLGVKRLRRDQKGIKAASRVPAACPAEVSSIICLICGMILSRFASVSCW